jgi:hypothetical protein
MNAHVRGLAPGRTPVSNPPRPAPRQPTWRAGTTQIRFPPRITGPIHPAAFPKTPNDQSPRCRDTLCVKHRAASKFLRGVSVSVCRPCAATSSQRTDPDGTRWVQRDANGPKQSWMRTAAFITPGEPLFAISHFPLSIVPFARYASWARRSSCSPSASSTSRTASISDRSKPPVYQGFDDGIPQTTYDDFGPHHRDHVGHAMDESTEKAVAE